MPVKVDKVFGKLTVKEDCSADYPADRRGERYRCVCECGEERIVIGRYLTSGQITMCKTCSKTEWTTARKVKVAHELEEKMSHHISVPDRPKWQYEPEEELPGV